MKEIRSLSITLETEFEETSDGHRLSKFALINDTCKIDWPGEKVDNLEWPEIRDTRSLLRVVHALIRNLLEESLPRDEWEKLQETLSNWKRGSKGVNRLFGTVRRKKEKTNGYYNSCRLICIFKGEDRTKGEVDRGVLPPKNLHIWIGGKDSQKKVTDEHGNVLETSRSKLEAITSDWNPTTYDLRREPLKNTFHPEQPSVQRRLKLIHLALKPTGWTIDDLIQNSSDPEATEEAIYNPYVEPDVWRDIEEAIETQINSTNSEDQAFKKLVNASSSLVVPAQIAGHKCEVRVSFRGQIDDLPRISEVENHIGVLSDVIDIDIGEPILSGGSIEVSLLVQPNHAGDVIEAFRIRSEEFGVIDVWIVDPEPNDVALMLTVTNVSKKSDFSGVKAEINQHVDRRLSPCWIRPSRGQLDYRVTEDEVKQICDAIDGGELRQFGIKKGDWEIRQINEHVEDSLRAGHGESTARSIPGLIRKPRFWLGPTLISVTLALAGCMQWRDYDQQQLTAKASRRTDPVNTINAQVFDDVIDGLKETERRLLVWPGTRDLNKLTRRVIEAVQTSDLEKLQKAASDLAANSSLSNAETFLLASTHLWMGNVHHRVAKSKSGEDSQTSFNSAVREYDKAIAVLTGLKPNVDDRNYRLGMAHYSKARTLWALRHLDEAVLNFELALNRYLPKGINNQFAAHMGNNLALYYAQADKLDAAKCLAYARKAVASNADYPPFLDTLAVAQSQNGDFEAAEASAKRAIENLQIYAIPASDASQMREHLQQIQTGKPVFVTEDQLYSGAPGSRG